jgi:hypothetical protein
MTHRDFTTDILPQESLLPKASRHTECVQEPKYLGEREEGLMKKRGRQTGKERFTIHANLCGGGDLLKAQGLVASYLADRLCNLSNDRSLIPEGNGRFISPHVCFRSGGGRTSKCKKV